MKKIAFIGAGSFGFTRSLVRDILTYPALADCELALMDIDAERLSAIKKACNKIVGAGKYPAKVTATQDRAAALDGADGVLITILAGGVDVWRYDVEIPMEFGVDINVGDTRGPAGIFRNPAHDARHAGHCPGYQAPGAPGGRVELHEPHGHAVPGGAG